MAEIAGEMSSSLSCCITVPSAMSKLDIRGERLGELAAEEVKCDDGLSSSELYITLGCARKMDTSWVSCALILTS